MIADRGRLAPALLGAAAEGVKFDAWGGDFDLIAPVCPGVWVASDHGEVDDMAVVEDLGFVLVGLVAEDNSAGGAGGDGEG